MLTGNVAFGIKDTDISVLLQNSSFAAITSAMTWDLVWASSSSLPSRQRKRTDT